MPVFRYKAVTEGGSVLEGRMEARTQSAVIDRLHDLGHTPVRAEEVADSGPAGWLNRRIFLRRQATPKDLSLMTRELATLLKAGLPLDRTLEILVDMASAERLGPPLRQVLEDVRGGASLGDAMAARGRMFPRYYVNMVRAGEAGGALEAVLERLAEYIAKSQAVSDTIKSALIYPVILLVMAGASIVVLLTVVLPEFRPLFEDAGASLPLATQIVLAVGDGLQNDWWAIVAVLAALLALLRWQRSTPERKFRWDRMVLRQPLFGAIVTKVEVARFARTLGTLLNNGVTLLTGLGIVKEALSNSAMAGAVADAESRLKEGQGLAEPLAATKVFPSLATHLMRVGEESGRLEEMLIHVADIYENEVQRSVERLLSLLVPALTIGLGVIIGLIITSVLMAILSVNSLVL